MTQAEMEAWMQMAKDVAVNCSFPDVVSTNSNRSVFVSDEPDTETKVKYFGMSPNGLGLAYTKPASDGGKYMTRSYFNELAGLGINYLRAVIAGYCATWDAKICQKIGGYPKGAVLNHPHGRKMVSLVDNNTDPLPEKFEDSQTWRAVRTYPCFAPVATSIKGSVYSGFPLENMMGSTGATGKGLLLKLTVGARIGINRSVPICFRLDGRFITNVPYTYIYGDSVVAEKERQLLPFLLTKPNQIGSLVLKLSRWPDIYDNPAHSSDYVLAYSEVAYGATGNNASAPRYRHANTVVFDTKEFGADIVQFQS